MTAALDVEDRGPRPGHRRNDALLIARATLEAGLEEGQPWDTSWSRAVDRVLLDELDLDDAWRLAAQLAAVGPALRRLYEAA